MRTQRWKYVEVTYYRGMEIPLAAAGYAELYDMTWDRAESYSLAAGTPTVVQDMQSRLKRANGTCAPFKKGVPPAILMQKQAMEEKRRG